MTTSGRVDAGVAQTVEEGPDPRPGNPNADRNRGEEQRAINPEVPGSIPGPSLDSTSGMPTCTCKYVRKGNALNTYVEKSTLTCEVHGIGAEIKSIL